jgi:molybdenum cofactor biosynthesis enzyme MoaA
LIKNRLTELTYFTTNLCNLRCKHCFVTEELNSKHEELLTISEIVKMGKYIPHMQRVHLGGGEPFMRDDISDLAVYLSNTWKTGVICIPTNGWFGENIIKTIEKFGEQGYGNLRLHFSINSPDPKDMDNFAQVTNTFKNWRKNIQLAKEVSKKYDNITLVALSTFNEFNQDSFIELIDFVMDEVGVDDFSFQLVRYHGD